MLSLTIFYGLILPMVVFAGNGHSGCNSPHGEYSLVVYNCIKGRTLYPRVTYSNLVVSSHKDGGLPGNSGILSRAIPGPSKGNQCGPGIVIINDVYAKNNHMAMEASDNLLANISGLNGGTLVLSGNSTRADDWSSKKKMTLPDGNTVINIYRASWAMDGTMILGFVSNRNYTKLPYDAKCPVGTTKKGAICVKVKHLVLHHCFGVVQDPYYEAHVYIFSAKNGEHGGLPNFPSASGQL